MYARQRQSIDLNKTALAGIVAGLFALLGLTAGAVPGRISIELHRTIRRVLRPAESAVRRLIVVMALFVKVNANPPAPARPMPKGIVRTGQGKRVPTFQLFDPRQHFYRPKPRVKAPGPGPRVRNLDWGYNPIFYVPQPPAKHAEADGQMPSAHIERRLRAIKAALENLPAQAKRLARVLAARQNVPQLKLITPLRPGRPPGHRQRPRLEIDGVLRECEWLARNTLPPDSS